MPQATFPAPEEKAPWGPIRIAFLNYGSDPIVAFDPDMAWTPPAWLGAPRAADHRAAVVDVEMQRAAQAPVGAGPVFLEGLDLLLGSLGPSVTLLSFEVLRWQIGWHWLLLTISLGVNPERLRGKGRMPLAV